MDEEFLLDANPVVNDDERYDGLDDETFGDDIDIANAGEWQPSADGSMFSLEAEMPPTSPLAGMSLEDDGAPKPPMSIPAHHGSPAAFFGEDSFFGAASGTDDALGGLDDSSPFVPAGVLSSEPLAMPSSPSSSIWNDSPANGAGSPSLTNPYLGAVGNERMRTPSPNSLADGTVDGDGRIGVHELGPGTAPGLPPGATAVSSELLEAGYSSPQQAPIGSRHPAWMPTAQSGGSAASNSAQMSPHVQLPSPQPFAPGQMHIPGIMAPMGAGQGSQGNLVTPTDPLPLAMLLEQARKVQIQMPRPIQYAVMQTKYSDQSLRWTQSTKMMSAYEIDTIIKMQRQQLRTDNPYTNDYYHQNALKKSIAAQLRNGVPLHPQQEMPVGNHTPLYDSTNTNSYTRKMTEMPGVLGKIPTHSVRAPRPVVQLQAPAGRMSGNENTTLREVTATRLAIENAYELLIDVEDINDLLEHTPHSSRETVQLLLSKRAAIIEELFEAFPLFLAKPNAPFPERRENSICAWQEDEAFLRYLLPHKGRSLFARAIPLLPPFYSHALLQFFMRNFALFAALSTQTPDQSFEILFERIFAGIRCLPLPQTVACVQTLLQFHSTGLLIHVLRNKHGATAVSLLFTRAAQLLLQCPPHLQQQMAPVRSLWAQLVEQAFSNLQGSIDSLFIDETKSDAHFALMCSLLSSIAVHTSSNQRLMILAEIRDRMAEVMDTHPNEAKAAHQLVQTLVETSA